MPACRGGVDSFRTLKRKRDATSISALICFQPSGFTFQVSSFRHLPRHIPGPHAGPDQLRDPGDPRLCPAEKRKAKTNSWPKQNLKTGPRYLHSRSLTLSNGCHEIERAMSSGVNSYAQEHPLAQITVRQIEESRGTTLSTKWEYPQKKPLNRAKRDRMPIGSPKGEE